MIKLYDFELSGHAHRVRLMLSLLNLEYEKVSLDLANGEHKKEPYKSINPFSLVPVLDDDGVVIRDSVAILAYLATKYGPQWYPQEPEAVARIHEWLSLSTREIAEGPGRARLITVFGADFDQALTIEESHALLTKINDLLADQDWMAINAPTIADIACYSYIAHAPEGKVSLDNYPNILRWLAKVEALEGFIPMQKTAIDS
ncbi:glutathione S-transferase family protein [Agarilytica rhodophyticola]|uniref:glutathione S-transferase family protein n=1 Tax=Agarilytica rhodophyticola TaxID=1737490 RepID=UPI000B343BB2|nr:glutathione S-transferase [Agarilytica rhodophyticola]